MSDYVQDMRDERQAFIDSLQGTNLVQVTKDDFFKSIGNLDVAPRSEKAYTAWKLRPYTEGVGYDAVIGKTWPGYKTGSHKLFGIRDVYFLDPTRMKIASGERMARQVASISDGTLASVTGGNRYEWLDKVKVKLIAFVSARPWGSKADWQDAWQAFMESSHWKNLVAERDGLAVQVG